MPMARHALADDPALQHVERGEQCRRAVALVIMGHRPAAAALHRQPWLRAVERLDLRLLVDRQHQRVLGRIDVETDDILDFGGELRVVRQLEGPHPMRLQAVRRPNPLHAAVADPGGLRQGSARPVRRLARRLAERHLDHPLDHHRRQRRLAGRAGSLMQQAVDAFGHEARLPGPDSRLALAGLPLDRHRAYPFGAQKDNPSPPNVAARAVPPGLVHGLQPLPGARAKPNLNAFPHPARLAYPRAHWNHSSAPIH